MIKLMNQKGFTPILVILLITVTVGGYLVYSGKINLNKFLSASSQIATINKTSNPNQNNNYPSELQGYPIYPKAKFIKKEAKTPSDYTNCQNSDPRIIACNYNTMNYIFSIDEPYNYEDTSNSNFYKWYNNNNNLLDWKKDGGAQGISGYNKGNDSFDLLYGVGDSGKIEIIIRIPTKNDIQTTSDGTTGTKKFSFGYFTFSIPTSEIASNYTGTQVKKSMLDLNSGDVKDECAHTVEGIYSLFLFRGNFRFSATSWSPDGLKFKDQADKKNFLEKYKILSQANTANEIAQAFNQTLREANQCTGGGVEVEFSSKLVSSSRFDKILFREVALVGEVVNFPERVLIVSKNDNWFVVSEEQKIGEYKDEPGGVNYYYPDCPGRTKYESNAECEKKVWLSKYKNAAENDNWIQNTLNALSY